MTSSQPLPQPHHQSSSLPYLLLDVRDKESYDQCHVIGGDQENGVIVLYLFFMTACSYPAVTLSRSCNYFTREILDFVSILNPIVVEKLLPLLHCIKKNKPGKIIILYDEDERIAPQAATTFVQREVDNIFMLSGGMVYNIVYCVHACYHMNRYESSL